MSTVVNLASRTAAVGKKGLLLLGIALLVSIGLLAKDSPQPRTIAPPARGQIVATPQVGGLHHRYDRRAA